VIMSDEANHPPGPTRPEEAVQRGRDAIPAPSPAPLIHSVEESPVIDLLYSFVALQHGGRQRGPYAAWAQRHVAALTIAQQRQLRRFPYVLAFEALVPLLSGSRDSANLLGAMAELTLADYLRIVVTAGEVAPDTPLDSDTLVGLVGNPVAARAFVDGQLALKGRTRAAVLQLFAHPDEERQTLLALLQAHAVGAFAEIETELARVRERAAVRLRTIVAGISVRWPTWLGPYRDLTGFSPVALGVSAYLGTGFSLYFHEISRSLLDSVPGFEPFIIVVGAQRALSPTEIGPRGLSMIRGEAPPDPDGRMAAVFAALGDTTRIRLMRLLAERPHYGQELAAAVGIAPPSAWRHLGILDRAGLVSIQRRAHRTYYVLQPDALQATLESARRLLVRATSATTVPDELPGSAISGLRVHGEEELS
jgi:DNA-binding transcriptional ArsR family regulator